MPGGGGSGLKMGKKLPTSVFFIMFLTMQVYGGSPPATFLSPRISFATNNQHGTSSSAVQKLYVQPFSKLDLEPKQIQNMLRIDISRRYTELNLLALLGKFFLTFPWIFDAFFPTVFEMAPYEIKAAPCFRKDGHFHMCLKESSVLARGIPFRLVLTGDDDDNISTVDLVGIGPDLTLDEALRLDADAEQLRPKEVEKICHNLQNDPRTKKLVVKRIVSTILERLTPVANAIKRNAILETVGEERIFIPKHDLWAKEGSSEKWLQNVAEYYFADARLQTVRFEGGEESRVLFEFYYDPTEPLNSDDIYKNINPEVISCFFPKI